MGLGERRRLRAVNESRHSSFDGVAGDDYDPHAFYVRSIDPHGHTIRPRVSIHPDVYAEISRLLASGALIGTPIHVFGDFVRDAITHRMHTLGEQLNDPKLMEAAQTERRIATIDEIVREREGKARLIKDAREALDKGIALEDAINVELMVETYESLIESLRDPYASQLERLVKDARRWLRGKEGEEG